MTYKKLRVPSLFWVLVVGLPYLGFSCECPEKLTSPEQANLVFRGRVVQVNTNWISGGWKFTFQVEESWKRASSKLLIINTAWEKDCGYIFEEGKEYLVYVYKGFTMRTSACMGNTLWEDSHQTEISALGPPFSPQKPNNLRLMISLVSLLGFLAISFIVLILVRGKRNRRK